VEREGGAICEGACLGKEGAGRGKAGVVGGGGREGNELCVVYREQRMGMGRRRIELMHINIERET
jgi:hypothetical protein